MTESTLPLHFPVFDKISDSHFAPAFDRGMQQQLIEVAAITANADAPTFDNTIVALERSGQILQRTSAIFFSQVSVDNNDARKSIQAEYAPKLAAHHDAIALNLPLFERIQKLYDTRDDLGTDAEGVRLIERYHTDFVRAGAKLAAPDQVRLKQIDAELAKLGTQFSQNVLAEVNDSAVVVDTRDELAGLTDEQIGAAAAAPKTRGLEGKYVIALLNTTGQPPEAQLQDHALRERLHKASVTRGSRDNRYDNTAIVPQALLDKVLASSKFNQGFATTEYLGAAMLDQSWHQVGADDIPGADGVMAFEAAALKANGTDYVAVPPRYRTPYFSHIMGGYAAGYYAYIWSEVLDANSVEWIKAHGSLTRANGDRFRQTLLSRGGSKDAMQLFHDFTGEEPQIEPLLVRRGLDVSAAD